MSWLSSFLHPERGYEEAQKELDKYYQQAQQYQQPYMQHGEEAYGGLSGAMNSLLNPEELYSQWSGGYQESPAAKYAEESARNRGLDAASSLGLMGSTPALQAIQAGTSRIGAEDRQNYLNDLMQKYLSGIGVAQNIYGTGANAAGQLGQNAMNMGQNAAQMKYNQTNAQGNLFGNLLGTGASFAGGLVGNYLNNKWNPMGSYGGGYSPGYGMPMYR